MSQRQIKKVSAIPLEFHRRRAFVQGFMDGLAGPMRLFARTFCKPKQSSLYKEGRRVHSFSQSAGTQKNAQDNVAAAWKRVGSRMYKVMADHKHLLDAKAK